MAQRRPTRVKVKKVGPLERLKRALSERLSHSPNETREYRQRLQKAKKRMAA